MTLRTLITATLLAALATSPAHADPVFQMDFNDASGKQSLEDRGTTGATGKFGGAAKFSTIVAPSNKGGFSAVFDGSDFSSVDFGDVNAVDGLKKMTITAWIRPDVTAGGPSGSARIVSDRVNPDGFDFYYHDSDRALEFVGNGIVANGGGSINPGVWTFVAVTYNGSIATFYTGDGTTLSTGDTKVLNRGGLAANAVTLIIGNRTDGRRSFDGLIDNVRIYDSVESRSSLRKIMQANDVGPDSGPTAEARIEKPTPPAKEPVREKDNWRERLYIPTQIDKQHGHYMIVACWQHRIIFGSDVDAPPDEWRTLSEDIAGPHSVASYKEFLLTEDTGRNGVVLFRWDGRDYVRVQHLGGMPARPHRVHWHDGTHAFWVIGCNNQTLYKLAFDETSGNPLSIAEVHDLTFQEGAYSRSMTIVDDEMYFTAGGKEPAIHRVAFTDGELVVLESYPTPDILGKTGEMNDVFLSSDGWWYLTSTNTAAIIRTRSLEDMAKGDYEDVKSTLGITATPYYLSEFDGRIWVPSIYQNHSITSFKHDDEGAIVDVQHHQHFGPWVTGNDEIRAREIPR